MITTCDEKFQEAKDLLAQAQKILGEIFTDRPSGFDAYKKTYLLEMHERYNVLTKWIVEDTKGNR
jgi:hypothetical protein